MIDIENIDKKYYKYIKYKVVDGIKYVIPEYYKIDLYSILSQPININLLSWNKTLDRLNIVEQKYKYKKNNEKFVFHNIYFLGLIAIYFFPVTIVLSFNFCLGIFYFFISIL